MFFLKQKMSKYDIKKRHRLLLWKKTKYTLKSLFIKPKSLFVDFLTLENIDTAYCNIRTVVKSPIKIRTYHPKRIAENQSYVETSTVKIEVFSLKNVMVTGNSSFFVAKNKSKLFYEKLHTDDRPIYIYEDENVELHSDSLARIRNYDIKEYSDDAIFFGGIFTFNYYHFLIDILAKTQFLESIPNSKSLKIVLDSSIKENENLKTVAQFFLKDYEVEYLEKGYFHAFKNLWFITTPNITVPNIMEGTIYEADFTKISPASIEYVRETCLANYDIKKVNVKPVSKVFIARKSIFRKYNEDELVDIAKIHGFEPVYFEDLNIHEQIFIMNNADYIVGASGAAWTNLLFSKENSKGLTWLGTVWGDFSVFSTLAKLVGFDLYYIRNESKTSNFHEDYTIDPQVFEEQLIQLLKIS